MPHWYNTDFKMILRVPNLGFQITDQSNPIRLALPLSTKWPVIIRTRRESISNICGRLSELYELLLVLAFDFSQCPSMNTCLSFRFMPESDEYVRQNMSQYAKNKRETSSRLAPKRIRVRPFVLGTHPYCPTKTILNYSVCSVVGDHS